MNILIVEDRPSVAYAIAQCFEGVEQAKDVHVVHAYDDAVTVMSKRHYDVFLLDINLDKSRNGIELCKSIRESNKDSLVVFVSGFVNEKTMQQIYDAGGNDFIRKPFVRREIKLKVVNWWKFIKAGRTKEPCLEYNGMSYDLERSEFSIEGKVIPLTKALRRLCVLFLQNPENIIPYSRIQREIWGDHDTSLIKRNIKERIFELRKRFPKAYAAWITSEAGEGYVLRAELN